MRIFIDIGHPAHVHYFKNFIKIMQAKGHSFFVTARDKEITFALLEKYKIPFTGRGKGSNSLLGKIIYLLKADLFLYKKARAFKPDIFMSFASPYAAQASKLMGKPHIAFDDTEHAKLELMLYPPFTDFILTPDCFKKDLGKKHIKFNSYIEFTYLHPNYFLPDVTIKKSLGINEDTKFVLFRYISWDALHDRGHSGIPDKVKKELIKLFEEKNYKVLISSEKEVSPFFAPYQIKISPEKIHDVIAAADFFIGESGTMATEACVLGTPSFFINSLNAGVFEEEEKFGLLYSFRSANGVIDKASELLNDNDLKAKHHEKKNVLVKSKIDVTALMVWFIENYPQSSVQLKQNPNYQQRFK